MVANSLHQQHYLRDASAQRAAELRPSLQDWFLRPVFQLLVRLFQVTSFRIYVALILLPLYFARQVVSVLPRVLRNAHLLSTQQGRSHLRQCSDAYRQKEQKIAAEQYNGSYRFSPGKVLPTDDSSLWKIHRVEVPVCGINARVAHVEPLTSHQSRKRILLVHGNPSWGYIWRNIIPILTAAGHEVFSIDWLGHGASDKPIDPPEISFELHMHTLKAVIQHFDLDEFYIAAHDWGGCVVLCTVPSFPSKHKCAGLFLLNTFLPPRPYDISWHYYLLYWIWFFSTGILGPLLSDSLVLRFMAPNITTTVCEGYSRPYTSHPAKAKASINRFSHIVPGTPDWVLKLRESGMWRMLEGLVGPHHLTNINAQASLARRNTRVRQWWSGKMPQEEKSVKGSQYWSATESYRAESAAAPRHVMILFGQDDPLLPGFRQILADTIKISKLVRSSEGDWISGAGHYPMEQKPEVIARCINDFLELTKGLL